VQNENCKGQIAKLRLTSRLRNSTSFCIFQFALCIQNYALNYFDSLVVVSRMRFTSCGVWLPLSPMTDMSSLAISAVT